MNKILITGASGLIGRKLTNLFLEKNLEVNWLVRNIPEHVPQNVNVFLWKPENLDMPEQALEEVHTIINLAGAGIADKRWTESRKLEIEHSRVSALRTLGRYLAETRVKLHHLIGASAIGYYGGVTTNKIFTENDKPGTDFLAQTCIKWEREVELLEPFANKISIVRIGVVFSKDGGALPKMASPIKNFMGSILGSGKQIIPWIHEEDLVNIFYGLYDNSLPAGIYNAVAPEAVTNKDLTLSIAKILNRPVFPINIPEIMLRVMLGEMSVLVTKGSAISAQKLINHQFKFKYPNLSEALNHLFR